jgi:hypothetical protein
MITRGVPRSRPTPGEYSPALSPTRRLRDLDLITFRSHFERLRAQHESSSGLLILSHAPPSRPSPPLNPLLPYPPPRPRPHRPRAPLVPGRHRLSKPLLPLCAVSAPGHPAHDAERGAAEVERLTPRAGQDADAAVGGAGGAGDRASQRLGRGQVGDAGGVPSPRDRRAVRGGEATEGRSVGNHARVSARSSGQLRARRTIGRRNPARPETAASVPRGSPAWIAPVILPLGRARVLVAFDAFERRSLVRRSLGAAAREHAELP